MEFIARFFPLQTSKTPATTPKNPTMLAKTIPPPIEGKALLPEEGGCAPDDPELPVAEPPGAVPDDEAVGLLEYARMNPISKKALS